MSKRTLPISTRALSPLRPISSAPRSAARSRGAGASIEDTVRQLARFEFTIVPFDAEQAALAASLRPLTRSWGQSLGDRACLALALKTSLPALTAEGDWEKCGVGVNVVKIR